MSNYAEKGIHGEYTQLYIAGMFIGAMTAHEDIQDAKIGEELRNSSFQYASELIKNCEANVGKIKSAYSEFLMVASHIVTALIQKDRTYDYKMTYYIHDAIDCALKLTLMAEKELETNKKLNYKPKYAKQT